MEAEKKLTGYPSIDKPWLKYYTDEAFAHLKTLKPIRNNAFLFNKRLKG